MSLDDDITYMEALKNLKLINSIPLISEAWSTVTEETIINFFNKALRNWEKYSICDFIDVSKSMTSSIDIEEVVNSEPI